jgi:hypothetical protein
VQWLFEQPLDDVQAMGDENHVGIEGGGRRERSGLPSGRVQSDRDSLGRDPCFRLPVGETNSVGEGNRGMGRPGDASVWRPGECSLVSAASGQ